MFVVRFHFKAQPSGAQRLCERKKFARKAFPAEFGPQIDLVDPDRQAARFARIGLLQERKSPGCFAVAQEESLQIVARAHTFGKGARMIFAGNGMFHGGGAVKFFGKFQKHRLVLRQKFAYHAASIAEQSRSVNLRRMRYS